MLRTTKGSLAEQVRLDQTWTGTIHLVVTHEFSFAMLGQRPNAATGVQAEKEVMQAYVGSVWR
jgi:hypothetical protein